jgi:hypothetical protein
MEWDAKALIALSGVVVSLFLAYFPWVKDWFDGLDSRWKPLVNVGILVLVSGARLLWACKVDWACVQLGLPSAIEVLLYAIVANQVTYTTAVRQVKQEEMYQTLGDYITEDTE